MYLGHVKVLLGMFLSLKTLYRKRTVIWPFYFYTIIRTLSDFLLSLLKSKFENNRQTFDKIYNILNIEAIPSNVLLKNLSDGQKQKLKLLSFLLEDHDLIILDEVTNALDKKTVNEIYEFLNDFIQSHQTKTIINITHNLSDLSALPGKYFIFKDLQIEEYQSKEEVINDYINL
ncbi:ABC superfamily ATP binding cassette transporter, ABC protein [Staphylococcus aureus]|nr:ABC superfamily ATP binding cassette transporter, ABC protein [Staphylococcus aureus]GBS90365.1 ABC superfamily ATP binding cassette transporter, ABC protein [Staphylococcus aureus]GBS92929.1 ABC superfamily ATP binding cassette transporter, ABC protein [Staphylococcus aureus]GBT84599.1 ABC superfamily ATP binding cassette transporter, ABC protein [Staphylococcus aureus]GBT86872.1 ABC superfamily ATP binding cassette transporter, ABC protein [Staphylococcus aureus]